VRLRSKILLLLLLVSAIPTIIAGGIGFISLISLGDQMASETSQALLNDAEIRLHELVHENGKLIGLATNQLDMAVRVQQVSALRAMTSDEVQLQNVVYAEDFDDESTAPPNLITLQMFDYVREDGSAVACPVSYDTQAIIQPANIDAKIASRQSQQLLSMDKTYLALSMAPGVPAMRYFTATVSGISGTYPGHGGIPEEYDVLSRKWFKFGAQSAGHVLHVPPSVDASTRRIVVAAVAPIIDADGKLLGVTGAERSVVDVLHSIQIPTEWRSKAIIQVVIPQNGKLRAIASQNMKDGGLAWNETPDVEWITNDSPEFDTLVSSVSALKSGCIDLYSDGIDTMVAYAPIEGMEAALVIWVPHDVIAAEAIQEYELVQKNTLEHASIIGSVAVVIIFIVILLALIISKMVSKPIVELTNATAAITEGNFNVSVENCGNDEIGELTRNFNTMVPHLKERLELQESLVVAKQIQQCLLPKANPDFSGWEITGKCIYCDATGGDYYDFILPPDDSNHLRLVLGDVTGHGIASALMMATARSLLRGGVQCGDDPVQRLNDVNNSLVHDTPIGWFMTFFCLELQSDSSEVHWISAGHDPAIVVDVDGNVSELEGDDIPLGVNANWSFTGKGPTTIRQGSVIVMGTDGIWEARNSEGEMFDKPRLIEIIKNNRTKPVADICDTIIDRVLAFCGDAPRADDITMVVARRT
jgi:phosphoserine phosphatase RsbU/P